jgi:flavin-dependent dehydrogenase
LERSVPALSAGRDRDAAKSIAPRSRAHPDARYDALVIGAGPAGSALGALLARAGMRVALCEREPAPRDKLCGEFLSGESRALLGELGCLDELEALRPAPIRAFRFTAPSGAELRGRLPSEALGVSRRALDEVLLRAAARAGASVMRGIEVREVAPQAARADEPLEFRVALQRRGSAASERAAAGLVIAAHGRRARLDRTLGRSFVRGAHSQLAFKRHHRPREGAAGRRALASLDGVVEVHAFEGGYCGMSRVEGGRVNVCTLVDEPFLGALPSPRWDDLREGLCDASARLAQRLEALEPSEPGVHAVARIPLSAKERSARSILFVGDSAGMIAPFCGDGQAMALRSAQLLAELIARAPHPITGLDAGALAQHWERRWRREFGLRVRLGRWLQPLLMHGGAADAALRIASLAPPLARWLARSTRGD